MLLNEFNLVVTSFCDKNCFFFSFKRWRMKKKKAQNIKHFEAMTTANEQMAKFYAVSPHQRVCISVRETIMYVFVCMQTMSWIIDV